MSLGVFMTKVSNMRMLTMVLSAFVALSGCTSRQPKPTETRKQPNPGTPTSPIGSGGGRGGDFSGDSGFGGSGRDPNQVTQVQDPNISSNNPVTGNPPVVGPGGGSGNTQPPTTQNPITGTGTGNDPVVGPGNGNTNTPIADNPGNPPGGGGGGSDSVPDGNGGGGGNGSGGGGSSNLDIGVVVAGSGNNGSNGTSNTPQQIASWDGLSDVVPNGWKIEDIQ